MLPWVAPLHCKELHGLFTFLYCFSMTLHGFKSLGNGGNIKGSIGSVTVNQMAYGNKD